MTNEEVLDYLKNVNESPYESVLIRISKEALGIVIEALEKQIPMKVEDELDGWVFCKRCENLVSDAQEYCEVCGQSLKWCDKDDE